MPHTRYVDADGILITRLSGVVVLEELIELQKKLPSYVHDEELYELVIHSDNVELIQSREESVTSADNLKRALKGVRKAAIAFVTNRNYLFGVLRQLEMRVENEYTQLCVFRTEETALNWVNEMKSSGKADAGDG